jgi:hypothetical protein
MSQVERDLSAVRGDVNDAMGVTPELLQSMKGQLQRAFTSLEETLSDLDPDVAVAHRYALVTHMFRRVLEHSLLTSREP